MKNKLLMSLFVTCLFSLFSFNALADAPPTNSVAMSTIIGNIQDQGYVAVTEVEFTKGKYEAEAINKKGLEEIVNVDTDGKVTPAKAMPEQMSMLDIAKEVEAAGYLTIYKIQAKKDMYKINALDSKKSKVELKVDAVSGKINKSMFNLHKFRGDVPTNSVPMSTIITNLTAAGYLAVKEVEYEDGVYDAEVVNDNGQELKVNVDNEGNVSKPEAMTTHMSILDVAKKVEDAGYPTIYKIKAKKDMYKIKAVDSKGVKVELKVDAVSGNIMK